MEPVTAGVDTRGIGGSKWGIHPSEPYPTHPSQQCLLLGHMVNEAQGPGGAVEACMQAVVQVRQSLPLLLSAVWGLELGAAAMEGVRGQGQLRAFWAGPSPLSLGSSIKLGS